ncbi:hypothetical protein ASPZODRAFT_2067896 [Penicilliopsis zonata CBS 506.65]|uniref:DNA mismatch repair protein S5 domain-containing protein n=1 Tax=Penicilliopsis zonata CBS 506.65 TaxID=1073090 RepID=A0A1L9SFU9_9EURO|nr:hypothetical protein ASPZODRAFT_2067896 [Penicilliopsis zonata CBS 506.65]OJJ46155.1 hypothetical protein ASPZODRAFT_2067896 [Penicilliopsis zonata CBS 506.65]
MPIEALPAATVRAIGSLSVITDACSVVKELLDNALDAAASSVTIEVSQNTLDVIQVKDNGHGINPEDYAMVCRRSFTSKISTVDDLVQTGGRTLGFRGVALASMVEMAGAVIVTTRVESEVAGSCLKYGQDGELISSQRVSHPVGTAVRVTELLKHVPVRRQTAIKSAAKTLGRIKKLVQAYAVARPEKRIAFKVLKAKNESQNWVYAPGSNGTLRDAAMKVAGSEVVSVCTMQAWPEDKPNEGYRAVALLPKDDIDFSRVNNIGQFISVDGRPLTTTRGVGSNIAKLYKTYIRSASTKSIPDPFLCMHIYCPRGSYDVNIEPGKDDLLFDDSHIIMELLEGLFRHIYGDLEGGSPAERVQDNAVSESAQDDDSSSLLTVRVQPRNVTPHTPFKTPFPMNARRTPQSASSGSPQGSELESLNPWSVTRLNGRSGNTRVSSQFVSQSPTSSMGSRGLHSESLQSTQPTQSPQSVSSTHLQSPRTRNGALDTWFKTLREMREERSQLRQSQPKPSQPLQSLQSQSQPQPQQEAHRELEQAMDFEYRKRAANQHRNRYLAARAALTDSRESNSNSSSSNCDLLFKDRLRPSRNEGLQITMTIPADMQAVTGWVARLSLVDAYTGNMDDKSGLDVEDLDVGFRLEELMKAR